MDSLWSPGLKKILRAALAEDIGCGDVTSRAIFDGTEQALARARAKAEMVVAGLAVFGEAFRCLDPGLVVTLRSRDGDRAAPGDILAEVAGSARSILMAERVALNLLQRMSGIATMTARYVAAVEGTGARILDTRKTVPGLRVLDKYAVRVGGGGNHRFALYDGILVKDNHIAAAGGIGPAVARVRKTMQPLLKVEVEVRSLDGLREALAAGADVVMLDNMDVETMRRAVDLAAGRVLLEASGNVNLANVRRVAETGVDFISVGALTHSVAAADISLVFD